MVKVVGKEQRKTVLFSGAQHQQIVEAMLMFHCSHHTLKIHPPSSELRLSKSGPDFVLKMFSLRVFKNIQHVEYPFKNRGRRKGRSP